MKKIFYCIALLSLLLISCNKNDNENQVAVSFQGEHEVNFEEIKCDTAFTHKCKNEIVCDSIKILFLSPIVEKGDTAAEYIRQELIYWVFADSTITNMSSKEIVNMVVQNASKAYSQDVLELCSEDMGDPSILNFEDFVSTKVLYNDGKILSYQICRYQYLGGAHGLQTEEELSFNLETGDRIFLEDIFIDGYEAAMSDKIIKQIMLERGFESEEQMLGEFWGFENIRPKQNFSISEKGITFTYQPYEIACYAAGIIKVEIPFSSISNLIRDDFYLCK